MEEALQHRHDGYGTGLGSSVARASRQDLASVSGPQRWATTVMGSQLPVVRLRTPVGKAAKAMLADLLAAPRQHARVDGIQLFRPELTMETRLLADRKDALPDPTTRTILDTRVAGGIIQEAAEAAGRSRVPAGRLVEGLKRVA